MAITQAPDGAWSFTHGAQLYTGYESRQAAQEALYDVERGREPRSALFCELITWIDAKPDEEEAAVDDGVTLREESFGALSNGTPIVGVLDPKEPTGRAGIVNAWTDDFLLTAQDEPSLFGIQGCDINIEAISIEQINALRSVLSTDIPEQMIAAAVAQGRGDTAPPAFTGRVRERPHICDDKLDTARFGTVTWIDYICDTPAGPVTVSVPVDDRWPPQLYVPGEALGELAQFAQWVLAITTLLNDPHVKAALEVER